jgi:hypothetical protein
MSDDDYERRRDEIRREDYRREDLRRDDLNYWNRQDDERYARRQQEERDQQFREAVRGGDSRYAAHLLGLDYDAAAAARPAPGPQDGVWVNGALLTEATLQGLARLGLCVGPGRYWYDPRSGCAGYEGQGCGTLLPAGLPLGVPAADASAGTSGVFLNSRQLTHAEVAYLVGLTRGPVLPGRYWLDAQGFAGPEGGPAAVNLRQLARAGAGAGPGRAADGAWTWGNSHTGVSASGDGHNVAVFWDGGMYSQGD